MKRIILMMLGVLVIFIFLTGCAEQTEETIEITDEEGNLVGEAYKFEKFYRIKKPTMQKICPECTYTSKPIYVRIYEREVNQPGINNRIVFDHPFGHGWNNSIGLNMLCDAEQVCDDPDHAPIQLVGFDVETEFGYQYLVLTLGEPQDVDFGNVLMNLELTQVVEPENQLGYAVVKLIRK